MLSLTDGIVIIAYFAVTIIVGLYFSGKNKTSDKYFFAGRTLPGWVVAFSLMATIISSMTFLASPGFAYQENWRHMTNRFGYIIAFLVMLFLYMPFFRKLKISSAYEYLERRFGVWARLYAASGFILFQIMRTGIILYAVCLLIKEVSGVGVMTSAIVFGFVVSFYTIAGGLEAVIWTDFLQGCALIVGGFICLPFLLAEVPGGFTQIFEIAYADGKLSMGTLDFNWNEKTFWAMFAFAIFNFLYIGCVDQSTVQRYCAPRTDREARKALILGALLSLPVWIYFTFIGTAIYVFYKLNPDPEIATIAGEPERILPFFLLRQVPTGFAGFVIAGLLAAAMSTIDSGINASAATVISDFYKRFFAKNKDEKHYVSASRWYSFLFSLLMICATLIIHFSRTQTLADLQAMLSSILASGLLALFWLGFMTKRVGNTAALIGVIVTILISIFWIIAPVTFGIDTPEKFWMIAVLNIFNFLFTYLLSMVFKRKKEDLTDLTVWTKSK